MKRHTSNLLVRGKAKSYRHLRYTRAAMSKRGNGEPGERLKRARLAAGYESAAKAARALKMHYQNWIDHEAGRRGISGELAQTYARKLKVNWVWILTGHDPDARPTIPLMGAIGAGAEILSLGPEEIDKIELPPGAEEGDVAFILRGASMPPFQEGGIIVARPTDDMSSVLYRLAVVELDDTRRFFKRIAPATQPGCYTLLSLLEGAAPIANVRIISAARFKVYVEPE